MTDLLPCPFCGEPIIHTESDYPQFYFECSDRVHCGIRFNIYADSEEQAFSCMNARATLDRMMAARGDTQAALDAWHRLLNIIRVRDTERAELNKLLPIIEQSLTAQPKQSDVNAALDELRLKFYYEAPYYVSSFKEPKISDKTMNTIYRALTAQQPDVNAELLAALKLCLPRIEEIRIVDLGAVRDAEMQDYQERKVITRRELAETNELINKINNAIYNAEQKCALTAQPKQPNVNAELLEKLNAAEFNLGVEKSNVRLLTELSDEKDERIAELLAALKYAHSMMQPFCDDTIVKQAIANAEQKGQSHD